MTTDLVPYEHGHILIRAVSGRMLALGGLAALLIVVALQHHAGSDTATGRSRADEWGEPFVTAQQIAAIRTGMSENEVLRRLDGEGLSGFYTNGPAGSNWVPGPAGLILLFEYPLRDVGGAGSDTNITWWRICVQHGRVVGERRVVPADGVVGCWG